jgi:hypothetical protein
VGCIVDNIVDYCIDYAVEYLLNHNLNFADNNNFDFDFYIDFDCVCFDNFFFILFPLAEFFLLNITQTSYHFVII